MMLCLYCWIQTDPHAQACQVKASSQGQEHKISAHLILLSFYLAYLFLGSPRIKNKEKEKNM